MRKTGKHPKDWSRLPYRTATLLIAGTLLWALAGCSISRYMSETNAVDQISAFQLTDRDTVEPIDLAGLLYAYAPTSDRDNTCACPKGSVNSSPPTTESERSLLDHATSYFRCKVNLASETSRTQARNALQERILTASVQRCNAFKGNLQRAYSRTNFGLGLANTVAGTAGALVSGGAGNYWSGASAIFSGARAEYNQDYLANLAVYVIIDGIDKNRREVYGQIQELGQSKSYAAYPVEAAIKDSLYYHGLCSVMTGFQVAQSSIKEVENPGFSSSIRTLAKLKIAQRLDGIDKITDIDKVIEMANKIANVQYSVAGSALVTGAARPKTENETLLESAGIVEKTDTKLNQAIDVLVKEANSNANLKGMLDKLGLDPKPVANQNAGFPTDKCKSILVGLQKNESNSRLDATIAETDAKRAILVANAEKKRTDLQNILSISLGLAETYELDASKAIGKWDILLKTASRGGQEDIARMKNELNSIPKLQNDVLKQLISLCSGS
jgi:hypothetical protein